MLRGPSYRLANTLDWASRVIAQNFRAVEPKEAVNLMSKQRRDYVHRYENLYLCDMRPEFSEGGAEIALPPGQYRITL
jgi:hypothetical protein